MPIEHTSRSGEKYYLHVGETKTGKPKYYVARHARGPLAEAIPDGFEIYESPKGQVSLRKILPKLIFDEELNSVERELARIPRLKGSQVERKLKILTVHVADRKEEMIKELSAVMPWRWQVGRDSISERFWSYEAQLQFVLVDEEKRLFQTRRYCYLGSIDDWIDIGDPGSLAKLTKLYLKHLGQESYYELH
jgi:hypothetical protein